MYESKITFQDVTAGQLRISLDMDQFQQPMTISLQSMGILSAILLALSLALSLRMGRYLSTPLLQLRVWLRRIDEHTPGIERQDEIGDLARQLHANYAPEPAPEPEPEPEFEDEDDEPEFEVRNLRDPSFDETRPLAAHKPAPRHVVSTVEDDDDDDAFADLRDESLTAVAPPAVRKATPNVPQHTAVLAVQWARKSNCAVARARLENCRRATATVWIKPLRCTRAKSKP